MVSTYDCGHDSQADHPLEYGEYDDETKARWNEVKKSITDGEFELEGKKEQLQRIEDGYKKDRGDEAFANVVATYKDGPAPTAALRADVTKIFDGTYAFCALDGDGHIIRTLEQFKENTPSAWYLALERQVKLYNVGSGWNAKRPNCPIVEGISSLNFHYWVMHLVNNVDPTAKLQAPGGSGRGSCASTIEYQIRKWCEPFVPKKRDVPKKAVPKKATKKAAPKKAIKKAAPKKRQPAQ